MGIEPYLITSSVRAVLAQRLVRRICTNCKTAYKPTSTELAEYGMKLSDLKNGKLHKGAGCDSCVHSGYRGRLGIYELLQVDSDIQRVVLDGGDSEAVKAAARKNGMKTLRDYGRIKVIEGETTMEEVMRVA